MKKSLIILLSLSIYSCISPNTKRDYNDGVIRVSDSQTVYIIDYEGCEYLTTSRGAITHSHTCNNIKHTN